MTPMATAAALMTGNTDARRDRPLVVAVASSLLLHACLAAGLAAVVTGDDQASIRRDAIAPVLRAVLVNAPLPDAKETPPAANADRPTPPPVAVREPSDARTATATASSATPPATPRPGSAPGMRGVVEIVELRGSAPLGGEFDRRMAEEFAADPDQMVQLDPGASFGYPEEALLAGAEGHVRLWVVVGPNGSVEEKEALDGDPVFADHVLSRIDGMIGAPAMAGGRAIRHWLVLDIVFAIRPDEQDVPGAPSTAARVR